MKTILIILIVVSVTQSKVTKPLSDSSVQTNQSNKFESVIKQESSRADYSEKYISEGSHMKMKRIRSVENWISLTCLATSLIILLVATIIMIHNKAKRKSNLQYLWA